MSKNRRDKKDDVCFAYFDKKISRKQAAAQLSDLKYEEWEINLFLDDDQTGPDDQWYGDDADDLLGAGR